MKNFRFKIKKNNQFQIIEFPAKDITQAYRILKRDYLVSKDKAELECIYG